MAAPHTSTLLFTTTAFLSFLLLLLLPSAKSQSAPAPALSGHVNISGILDKAGQYTFLIRLINETHTAEQINNQANNSHDGMTVFAPTDNAFNNLPSGTLNNLSYQQHVQLVLYHTLPKYYTLENFQTVSNPVRTEASGQDGKLWGLNFTTQGNQVNVSTGIVEVPIYNQLSKDPRIAVYQVDKVLLPREFYPTTRAAAAPSPSRTTTNSSGNATDVGGGGEAPAAAQNPGNGSGKIGVGLGLMSGFWLLCMGLLS